MTFADCDTPMLLRLLAKYRAGLDAIDNGATRFACGGNTRRTIARWTNAVVRELHDRGVGA